MINYLVHKPHFGWRAVGWGKRICTSSRKLRIYVYILTRLNEQIFQHIFD